MHIFSIINWITNKHHISYILWWKKLPMATTTDVLYNSHVDFICFELFCDLKNYAQDYGPFICPTYISYMHTDKIFGLHMARWSKNSTGSSPSLFLGSLLWYFKRIQWKTLCKDRKRLNVLVNKKWLHWNHTSNS